MKQPTLVILAAGMGSRYGGTKQMDPIDAHGGLMIDYSIYDALRAGYGRIVCVIKKAIEADFRAMLLNRLPPDVDIRLAFQELSMLPKGFAPPQEREKPWGTAHALLCAREAVDGPFTLINADDYYGPRAYQLMHAYLSAPHKPGEYAMVAYPVQKTLTDKGTVSRGVCAQSADGFLQHIQEVSAISSAGKDGACYPDASGHTQFLPAGTPVSMNFWGFDQSIFTHLQTRFPSFLETGLRENPLKCEYMLPVEVQNLMQAGNASVRMLQSEDSWFGMTYREDRPAVLESLQRLKAAGVYPARLWDGSPS